MIEKFYSPKKTLLIKSDRNLDKHSKYIKKEDIITSELERIINLYYTKPIKKIGSPYEIIMNEHRDYDMIILIGDDQAIRDSCQALMDKKINERVTLGIIPYGKRNDFLKSLRINSIKDVYNSLISYGQNPFFSKKVDIIEVKDENNKRYYGLNSIVFGLENILDKEDISYQNIRLKSLFLRPQQFKLTIETKTREDYIYSKDAVGVIINNGSYGFRGMMVVPNAKPDDSFIDLLVMDYNSRIKFFIELGRIHQAKEEYIDKYNKGWSVITSPEFELFFSPKTQIIIDGENFGKVSYAYVEIIPKAINIAYNPFHDKDFLTRMLNRYKNK